MMSASSKKLSAIICPSILNADLSDLAGESRKLLAAGSDRLHLDVMDGHFVPNLTFGHCLIESLRKRLGNEPFFDVHLMVSEPARWLSSMHRAGANQFTFHLEALNDEGKDAVQDLIGKIKTLGLDCGIAIKPGTSVDDLIPFVDRIDNALIMTVEPGFGGQAFMHEQLEKVRRLRRDYPFLNIQVDGGVGPSNISECAEAGANVIVSGSAIINSLDQEGLIQHLRNEVKKYIRT